MSGIRGPLAERFWRKVDISGDCWLWTACVDRSTGYGKIGGGEQSRPLHAHRVSWELHFGPIPKGLFVCHRCDERSCVRPQHLFLGTHRDNMRDMVAKGRGRNHGGFPGERNPSAKLTAADVSAIRSLYANRAGSQELIGRAFGIGQSQVSAIVRGTSWAGR